MPDAPRLSWSPFACVDIEHPAEVNVCGYAIAVDIRMPDQAASFNHVRVAVALQILALILPRARFVAIRHAKVESDIVEHTHKGSHVFVNRAPREL